MPIASSSTASSLDISTLLNVSNTHYNSDILSEYLSSSISLPSLASFQRSTIPAFPSDRTPPTFVPLGVCSTEGLPFPNHANASLDPRAKGKKSAILAIPTPPRLRRMLTETICVYKWAEQLSAGDAPDHVPWEDPLLAPSVPWKPEGSIFPFFRGTLLRSRARFRLMDCGLALQEQWPASPAALTPPLSPHDASNQAGPSNRNTVSLGRPISSALRGKAKPLPGRVASRSKQPRSTGVAGSKFLGLSYGLEDLEQSIVRLDEEKKKQLEPPSLVLSNSHYVLALPLESSRDLSISHSKFSSRIQNDLRRLQLESSNNLMTISPPKAPTIAGRRGKDPLPQLHVSSMENEEGVEDGNSLYPGIPTAFLGSPSSYSPKFEASTDSTDMDICDMVKSLKGKCDVIHMQSQAAMTPVDDREFEEQQDSQQGSEEPVDTDILGSEEGNDDWAFANELVNNYGADIGPKELALAQRKAHDRPSCLPSDDNEMHSPEPATPPSTPASVNVPPFPPPSTPLPALPATRRRLCLSEGVPSVQGILKATKSVRFASLPSRHADAPIPSPAALLRPATPVIPLAKITNEGPRARPRRPTIVSPTQPRPVSMKVTELTYVGQLVPSGTQAANQDSSRYPTLRALSERKRRMTASALPDRYKKDSSSSKRNSTAVPSQSTPLSAPPFVKRFASSNSEESKAPRLDKENESSRTSKAPSSGGSPLHGVKSNAANENSLRRDIADSIGSKSSRVPIPLRNILTRFR